MTDSIDALIDRVIQREGGYVNNPNDAGGPTKYGITLATLHGWRHAPVSAADVKNLTTNEAILIYRSQYFTKPGLDAVKDPGIQEFLFDYGVNSGPGAAVRALQTALGVTADGDFGPASRAALDKINNQQALFYRLKCERYEMLLRFIGSSPGNAVFAIGWSNRLDQFEEKIV
jgi:lysozyme family protein